MRKFSTILFFALVVFGLVALSSAGIVEGQKKFDSSTYYFVHQILYGIIPGFLLFFLFSRFPYRKWQTFAVPLLLLALGLMVLVFVPGFGIDVKGAQRWLDLGIISVQPAEFLKFALIVYLAAWFGNREKGTKAIVKLLPFFLILGFTGVLLLMQPDFGTLSIVIVISVALYFFSGAKLWHFGVLMVILAGLLVLLAVAAPYRFERVKTFLNPESDKQGSSYHINQAKIGIGSGGVFGLGYGQSKQKISYLPEPVGDSIFAIIVEELGFVGGTFLVGLFVAFLFSLLHIAKSAPDAFSRLFVLGVAVWIGGQAFTNIAAITGVIPLTGVPLPLISYGSSSLVSIMGAMGIVRNIAES